MTILAKNVPRNISDKRKAEFQASIGAVAYCEPQNGSGPHTEKRGAPHMNNRNLNRGGMNNRKT